jgi:predicted transposase/invertase (TIGR01784 family)
MSKVLNRGDNWNKMKEDIPHLIGVFFLNKRFGDERKSIVETEEFDRIDKVQFWDRMRKYFIILENFDFAKIEQPSSKDCWIEIIKNLGERMYKISPSVYEKADPALLELIERAQFCNLTDDELARYEAGLKAIEDEIDFEEMLEEAKVKIATEAHAKGHAEGFAEGLAEAHAEGGAIGYAEGHAEGYAKGIKENQIEMAKKMLNMGMSIDLIAEISELSKEEIDGLR